MNLVLTLPSRRLVEHQGKKKKKKCKLKFCDFSTTDSETVIFACFDITSQVWVNLSKSKSKSKYSNAYIISKSHVHMLPTSNVHQCTCYQPPMFINAHATNLQCSSMHMLPTSKFLCAHATNLHSSHVPRATHTFSLSAPSHS
jgi:hypothetical protein